MLVTYKYIKYEGGGKTIFVKRFFIPKYAIFYIILLFIYAVMFICSAYVPV